MCESFHLNTNDRRVSKFILIKHYLNICKNRTVLKTPNLMKLLFCTSINQSNFDFFFKLLVITFITRFFLLTPEKFFTYYCTYMYIS